MNQRPSLIPNSKNWACESVIFFWFIPVLEVGRDFEHYCGDPCRKLTGHYAATAGMVDYCDGLLQDCDGLLQTRLTMNQDFQLTGR